MADDDLYRGGLTVRKSVLGEAHVARATAATTDFDRPFQELITRSAWGSVWQREELTKRDRSLITIAALIAMYRPEQLTAHLSLALDHGLTKEEIGEAITHLAFYASWPSAITASRKFYDLIKQREGGGAAAT